MAYCFNFNAPFIGYQSSVTVNTVYRHTKLPLRKWFVAVYLMSSGQGNISVAYFSQMVGIRLGSVHSVPCKLRQAIANRDQHWLDEFVKVNYLTDECCNDSLTALSNLDRQSETIISGRHPWRLQVDTWMSILANLPITRPSVVVKPIAKNIDERHN